MRVVVLRVDVPEERHAGPLRAHEGILATDEIDVARPQQPVVAALIGEGHAVGGQPTGGGATAGR